MFSRFCLLLEYNRVLQGITEYYRVLQSITEYCIVLQSITEYCRVLQSITVRMGVRGGGNFDKIKKKVRRVLSKIGYF